MTPYQKMYAVIATIPYGKVATYGQVAQAAGFFRGAQMVGWALRQLPPETDIPWPRVVAKGGKISIVNPKMTKLEQVRRLEEEGVKIGQVDGWYVVQGEEFWHEWPEALTE